MTWLADTRSSRSLVPDARPAGDLARGHRGAGAHDAERRPARAAAQQVVPQHLDVAEARERRHSRRQRPTKHDLATECLDIADEVREVRGLRMRDAPDLPVRARRSGVGAVRVAAVGAVRVAAVGAVA